MSEELDITEHPAFDVVKHDLYVEKGYCPSVHVSTAYCCLPQGHASKHLALYLLRDSTFTVGAEW